MEIYKDTEKQTAILICNEEEIELLTNACFYTTKKWYDSACKNNEAWKSDLDKQIGDKYYYLMEKLDNTRKSIKTITNK